MNVCHTNENTRPNQDVTATTDNKDKSVATEIVTVANAKCINAPMPNENVTYSTENRDKI